MKHLALIAALVSGVAFAQGMGGPGLSSGSFSARILASGATGSDLTLSGVITADSIQLTGASSAGASINMTSAAAGMFINNTNSNAGFFVSGISAANAGATPSTAGFKFYPSNALDATDLVFDVANVSNGSSLFSVNYQGDVNAARSIRLNGTGGIYTGATAGVATAGYYYQAGAIADSAGNSANDFASLTALTSGFDRYALRIYRDNGTTPIARVFTNGAYQNLFTAGTAGSGTGITTNVTSAVVPFVHKQTVSNAAMTAAGQTDITIWTTPVNTRLIRIVAEVTQVFTGGALSAVTVQCGNAAGGNQYLLANSVFTAQNTWGDNFAEIGAGLLSATVADMGTPAAGIPGAIAISCRFTCTGANCSAATQGSVTFEIEGVTYP